MIEKLKGNIFEIDCDAIVNPVNIVGFMGKGLALEYKKRYPLNFKFYKEKCTAKEFEIGEMLYFEENEKIIINFPTKKHYRSKSKIEHIELGLENLKIQLQNGKIKSIALPYLGCGLGQLNKDEVESLIFEKLGELDNVKVLLVDL